MIDKDGVVGLFVTIEKRCRALEFAEGLIEGSRKKIKSAK